MFSSLVQVMTSWLWLDSFRPSNAYICVSKLTIFWFALSPGWRQAIIWTNAGILLMGPLWEIVIEIHTFPYETTILFLVVSVSIQGKAFWNFGWKFSSRPPCVGGCFFGLFFNHLLIVENGFIDICQQWSPVIISQLRTAMRRGRLQNHTSIFSEANFQARDKPCIWHIRVFANVPSVPKQTVQHR